jgi:hypothetical protein
MFPFKKKKKDEIRVLTINALVDGISPKYAQGVIRESSEIYEKEFGIQLKLLNTYEQEIPKHWDEDKEMKNLRKISNKKSDLYFIISQNEANGYKAATPERRPVGAANREKRQFWMVKQSEKNNAIQTFCHELAHILGAKHVPHEGYMMNKVKNGQFNWAPETRATIMRNKYGV